MKVSYRFVVIAGVFITSLITANLIAVKLVDFGAVVLPAAVIVFPLSYIFGDILTEVYGFRQARRVIWLGFGCNLLFVGLVWLGGLLPEASYWEGQAAYETILGYAPRILLASFVGYLVGEFVNSFILAKMKVWTKGRRLWMRTIGSTIVGEGLDSAIFITIAFAGTSVFTPELILWHWLAKTGIEILATPVTYAVVNFLKKREDVDTYDHKPNFNPFAVND